MRSLTMLRRWILLAVLLAVFLLLVGPATAMESDNFAINWDVMGGGGEPIASDNFALNGTIGQGVIGLKSSTNYSLCSGYWCGAVLEYAIYLPLVLRNF
jgi:hypothetical protein